jgi:CheY-like chemotaxis protein
MASILLVEDTEMQAGLIKAFLRDSYDIAGWAQTQDEAVSLARETAPDVVVMDLNLSQGDGIKATADIKSYDQTIPIIVSTVNVTSDVRERAMEAGADAYLTKPYSKQELLELLRRFE